MRDVSLSVLDQSPVAVGTTSGQALDKTIKLARRTEELGYRRFWVTEHHNAPAWASSAPAVLIAHLAIATSRIRVGSGGVMLPNHAPLIVAEQFGTLEALHPGRIDLGVGRAPGTDHLTARMLRRATEGLSVESFPRDLEDLIGLFTGEGGRLPITATPGRGDMPTIWLLGSSESSARSAGTLGLPYSFAHHISASDMLPALATYRQHFRPSRWLQRPYTMVACVAICADTDDRAHWLSGPATLAYLQLHVGGPEALQPLASPEVAATYQYSRLEREFIRERFAGQAIGSPETVCHHLTGLVDRSGADELMLTTLVYDIDDRIHSFELISERLATSLRRPQGS